MLMGLTVSKDRSQGELNSYTAAAALQGGLESLVMPSADITSSTALDNGLNVDASNGANLREYADILLAHEKMMDSFDELSLPSVRSLIQYSNAA